MTQTSPPRGKIYDSILQTIGGTPLVRLNKIPHQQNCAATLLVKLECFNPLSSVKDRTALGLIEAAEQEGTLRAGGTVVEATSGNTGIGLAFIAAVKGYKLVLTMPENMSIERRQLLAFLGASLVLTPAAEGMAGAISKAQELAQDQANTVLVSQFANPANPAIHRQSTAQEIWADTQGLVDVFVAGVGTGGTIQGTTEFLKKKNPALQVIAVQPAQSPVLTGGPAAPHGIQGIGANFIPSLLDLGLIDECVPITEAEAMDAARALARHEGILAGLSSGAALAAAIKIAQRPQMAGQTIVTILPDTAERYLSTPLFS